MQSILSKIIVVLFLVSCIGCSYIADSIEAELTNRANFSIDAYYDSGSVIISWDANPDYDSFAGYEIYMTGDANDEFSEMIVVGAYYDIGSSSYFQQDGTLDNPSTSHFIHSNLPSLGIYFYRVGVIEWDERDYNNDGEDEKKPDFPDESLYKSYTHIEKISGSAMVEIF